MAMTSKQAIGSQQQKMQTVKTQEGQASSQQQQTSKPQTANQPNR